MTKNASTQSNSEQLLSSVNVFQRYLRAAVCKNRESQFTFKKLNYTLSHQKNLFSELISGKIPKVSATIFSGRYFQNSIFPVCESARRTPMASILKYFTQTVNAHAKPH